jgi:hypothetical protein
MAAAVFEYVAGEIERRSSLRTLEARGTLRLALKRAGLDAATVSGAQMGVVLERILPDEIRARGVPSPEDLCRSIGAGLRSSPFAEGPAGESPEAIFRRLASGS